MPTFNGNNGAFTPTTTNPAAGGAANGNWNLLAGTAGQFGKVVQIAWGGRLTTSTGYRTRWGRPSGTAVAGAASAFTGQPIASQPNYTAAGFTFVQQWATTNPTLPADPQNLYAQDWNAQGGVGVIVFPLANPWWIVNGILQSIITCLNVAGTDANGSSYGVTWEE
jgi:hypothetical protein